MFRYINDTISNKDHIKNSFVVVTKSQISVFDKDKHEIARITGMEIHRSIYINSFYIYICQDYSEDIKEQYADPEDEYKLEKAREVDERFRHPGLYAFNILSLFEHKFNQVLVKPSATSHNSRITRGLTQDTVTLMESLHQIVIMPIPHWNLMNFVGMESKSDYLIWKDSSDGFFTALHKNGDLTTWSTCTGQLLWIES